MNTEVTTTQTETTVSSLIPQDVIESLVLNGDLSKMNGDQKVQYYNHICKSLGLNSLTQPFEIINLKGKLKMYAKKDATDQLRRIYGVSVIKVESQEVAGIYMATVFVKDRNGREDSDVGAVPIANLQGEALANAIMKATTKAKRRATLSICGLGMLDESEIESIQATESAPQQSNTIGIDVIQVTPETEAHIEQMLTAIFDQRVPESDFLPETKQQFVDNFRGQFKSGQMQMEYANNVYNKVVSYFQ